MRDLGFKHQYDGLGRLTQAANGAATVEYDYNTLSSVERAEQGMTGLGSKELIYGYDSNQNVTSMRLPGSADEITYTRDYLNRGVLSASLRELN